MSTPPPAPAATSEKERSMKSTHALCSDYISELAKRRDDSKKHYRESGFYDIDKELGGWLHDGHLIVIAARPGLGKTTLSQQVAEHIAGANKEPQSAIFFTLEMSNYELVERYISRQSRVSVQKLKTGELTDEEFARATAIVSRSFKLSLFFVDEVNDIDVIVKKSKLWHEKLKKHERYPPLGLIVVDYLQLVRTNKYPSNRVLEVGYVSSELKRLAKELQVPVIAVAQLNRLAESRADKKPNLSDLRDSGQIEQDADCVLMIYRDEVYNNKKADNIGTAEILCVKNRHGPITNIKMVFSGENSSFGDYVGDGSFGSGKFGSNIRREQA